MHYIHLQDTEVKMPINHSNIKPKLRMGRTVNIFHTWYQVKYQLLEESLTVQGDFLLVVSSLCLMLKSGGMNIMNQQSLTTENFRILVHGIKHIKNHKIPNLKRQLNAY
jgi:hypothetical protein